MTIYESPIAFCESTTTVMCVLCCVECCDPQCPTVSVSQHAPILLRIPQLRQTQCPTVYQVDCFVLQALLFHLVLSTLWVLAIDMVSFLNPRRSSAASLSSARHLPDIVCISSIHLFLGRLLFLLPSPHASIIFFSVPFACITWPKNIIFCFAALCLSDKSPLACPISFVVCSLANGILSLLGWTQLVGRKLKWKSWNVSFQFCWNCWPNWISRQTRFLVLDIKDFDMYGLHYITLEKALIFVTSGHSCQRESTGQVLRMCMGPPLVTLSAYFAQFC